MTRKYSYYFCFIIVATETLLFLAKWVASLANISPSFYFVHFGYIFNSLTPYPIAKYLHPIISEVAPWLIVALVLRRLWLLGYKRSGVPATYKGLLKGFALLGCTFYMLSLYTVVMTYVISAETGRPAYLVLIPAKILIPWALFLTELLSFINPIAKHWVNSDKH